MSDTVIDQKELRSRHLELTLLCEEIAGKQEELNSLHRASQQLQSFVKQADDLAVQEDPEWQPWTAPSSTSRTGDTAAGSVTSYIRTAH